MKSELFKGSDHVPFPAFTGERVYMRRFDPLKPLPADLERWTPTVRAMLRGIIATGPAFLVIDQRTVPMGETHRRPGVHVDGYWGGDEALAHGGGGHTPYPAPSPGHRPSPGHSGGHIRAAMRDEALILASDVVGSVAYEGEWDGEWHDGGNADHVKLGELRALPLWPGIAWYGDTRAMLHESAPLPYTADRTLVRINLQGWIR